ncbi:MAG: S8 family serine peptidase [Bacteroidetes bacterium]|nr:S8 family serine peptidase [Bacteroidota bacterium]
MRKIYLLLFLPALLLLGSCKKNLMDGNPNVTALHMPNQNRGFIILAKEGEDITAISREITKLGGKNMLLKEVIKELGLIHVQTPDPNFPVRARLIPGVESVSVDLVTNWRLPDKYEALNKKEMKQVKPNAKNPPIINNNPYSFLQWGLQSVHADKAWQKGYGGRGAKVAVLDGGFIMGDEEIASNIILTHSFIDGESAEFHGGGGFQFSHGTHVAGTIAALNDGKGVVGVAPEAKLMLVKVISDAAGNGPWSAMINGIYYATVNGANVINMSLGGELPLRTFIDDNGTPDDPSDDMLIEYDRDVKNLVKAMNRATVFANLMGTTVIAAAGNDGYDYDVEKNFITYPANCLGVLAIASNGPLGWAYNPDTSLYVPSIFTNNGKNFISYGAPGGNYSLPLDGNIVDVGGIINYAYVFNFVFNIGGIDEDNGDLYYIWAAGTSMATPHVSGVAAMLYGKYGKYCSPLLVDQIFRATATDEGVKGKDRYFGRGQINAGKAVGL